MTKSAIGKNNNVSNVDPRFTKDPKDDRPICGSFRHGQKKVFKASGLTKEDLLADRELMRKYICFNNPDLTEKSIKNGRCKFHGSQRDCKHLIQEGKYSQFRIMTTNSEIAALLEKGADHHKDLNPELSMLEKSIADNLPIAMQEHDVMADSKVLSITRKCMQAFKELDVEKVGKLLKELEEYCEPQVAIDRAKKTLNENIQSYAKVFDVEVKRRSANGEYITRSDHLREVGLIIQLILPFVNDNEKEQFQEKLRRFLVRNEPRNTIGGVVPLPGGKTLNDI